MQVPLRLLPDPVPHVCETRLYFMALPPEYAARPLKKGLTIYVSENRIYE